MNEETVARIIIAVGHTLAKQYPPESIKMTEGGVDKLRYSYSGSFAEGEFQLRENPGGEFIEVKPVEGSDEFVISYSNQEVATVEISGSSGKAEDTYNGQSYYSIGFTDSIIRLDGITFQVS